MTAAVTHDTWQQQSHLAIWQLITAWHPDLSEHKRPQQFAPLSRTICHRACKFSLTWPWIHVLCILQHARSDAHFFVVLIPADTHNTYHYAHKLLELASKLCVIPCICKTNSHQSSNTQQASRLRKVWRAWIVVAGLEALLCQHSVTIFWSLTNSWLVAIHIICYSLCAMTLCCDGPQHIQYITIHELLLTTPANPRELVAAQSNSSERHVNYNAC